MRKKGYSSICRLMILCLLASLFFLPGCGAEKDGDLSEGLEYLQEEARKNAEEVYRKMREQREAWEKAEDISYIPESSEEENTPASEGSEPSEASGNGEDEPGPEPSDTNAPDPETASQEASEIPPETAPVPAEDPYADLKQQIETLNIAPLSEAETAQLRNLFDRTVFIGDSLTQAILTYGFFDENHIKYRRSASIADLQPEIGAALAMLPENIVFFTGLNDVSRFITDPGLYYEAYKEKIQGILSVRPDVHIYVLSLLPPSNDLARVNLNLARSPEFDEQLNRAAADTPAVYIDCHWMIRQQLYLDDGIHFKEPFYVVLMKYLSGEIFHAYR